MSMTSRLSMAGLLAWACGCVRLAALATALTVGPQIADYAWDHGTHVTPAQMAMHYLLMSQGITHHHHQMPAGAMAATHGAPGTSVEAGEPMMTFGSAFSPVALPTLQPPALTPLPLRVAADAPRPVSFVPAPDSPPPKALQAISLFI